MYRKISLSLMLSILYPSCSHKIKKEEQKNLALEHQGQIIVWDSLLLRREMRDSLLRITEHFDTLGRLSKRESLHIGTYRGADVMAQHKQISQEKVDVRAKTKEKAKIQEKIWTHNTLIVPLLCLCLGAWICYRVIKIKNI